MHHQHYLNSLNPTLSLMNRIVGFQTRGTQIETVVYLLR